MRNSSIRDFKKRNTMGVLTATGGTIFRVGGFTYHVFTSGGSFVPSLDAPAEVLVLGAGAGGGNARGGGGGGAAIEGSAFFSATFTGGATYTVTVGAKGIGARDGVDETGTSGGTSSFIGTGVSVSSLGGGGGGSGLSTALDGVAGGSGGGGCGGLGVAGSRGAASGSNTTRGGAGLVGGAQRGGGGGGATVAGATGTASGNGGAGVTLTTIDANFTSGNFSTFSGMTVISSGGGGGSASGTPGAGGTGAGSGVITGNGADAVSFGSGGGGGTNQGTSDGGDGQDGIVIVRY